MPKEALYAMKILEFELAGGIQADNNGMWASKVIGSSATWEN